MPTQSKRFASGYKVNVRGVGPFAFSHLRRRMPQIDPPLRYILLETGDVAEWPYEPPDVAPDPDDEDEYALYAQHQSYIYRNERRREWMEEKRVEFFKLHCIDLPLSFRLPLLAWSVTVYKWFARRIGGSVTRVPFREGYLTFLDTDVIQSVDAWQWVQEAAIIEEVTLSGILDAAQQFRRDVGEQATHASQAVGTAARGQDQVHDESVGGAGRAPGRAVD